MGQVKQGEPFSKLQPVYSLNLIDNIFEPKMEEYYHYYHLVHDKYTNKVIDGFHLVFVELKKFKPKTMTEKKKQVLWLRFLTEINASTEEVPQELLDNPEISKAIRLVEESAYTREQLLGYDLFWNRVRRDKDMDDELREVKEQLMQKDIDTARKLKAMSVMTIEQISEITGLTAEKIETL